MTEQTSKLEWTTTDDGWEAPSTMHDDGSPFFYRIAPTGDGWGIRATVGELLAAAPNDDREFESLHAAKEYCQGIEGHLNGDAEADTPKITDEQAERLFAARDAVRAAQREEDEAKVAHKEMTRAREAAQEQLEDLIDDIRHGQRGLFDEHAQAEESDRAWESLVILAELDLTESIVESLNDAGISTLGDLSARMEAGGQNWADDIDGIGKVKAEKVEEAMRAFWEQHPEYCREAEPTDATPADDAAG